MLLLSSNTQNCLIKNCFKTYCHLPKIYFLLLLYCYPVKNLKSHKQEVPLKYHKKCQIIKQKGQTSNVIHSLPVLLLPLLSSPPWLYNPTYTPPCSFAELIPSQSADLNKCHFPRKSWMAPKSNEGHLISFETPYSLLPAHLSHFVCVCFGDYLVTIFLPTTVHDLHLH